MTLATVPRYDRERVSVVGQHAVVVGASIAGLVAARVLADAFEQVTVVDRDPLPDEPIARKSVPQARHLHALQEAGRATVEDLVPGYGEDLLSAGGLEIDAASDFNLYDQGGFLADGPTRMPMYTASRPLFEQILRRRVSTLDGIHMRAGCTCTDYLVDREATTVEGVVIRNGNTDRQELTADLVVDATGRTSRTPRWLEENGYTPPEVDEVHVDLAYSTLLVERPSDDHRVFWAPASPPHTRGGGAVPIEDGYWQVMIHGVHGDHPPTDIEEFVDFTASLPIRELKQLLDRYPLTDHDIEHYPFPSNRRHRYENLDRFPDGLVVIGDAIASYNPIYGQGMSVAALEALVLHQTLAAGGRDDLAHRFFQRAEAVVNLAWKMAVGADFQFPDTTGPKPRGTDIMAAYLSRLTRKAHSDGTLREVLFRVIMLELPPTALLRPGVVWRVLRPTWPGTGPAPSSDSPKGSKERR